jgi:hypothetical protein
MQLTGVQENFEGREGRTWESEINVHEEKLSDIFNLSSHSQETCGDTHNNHTITYAKNSFALIMNNDDDTMSQVA